MGKRHHRKGYRRKDGTWVRATNVRGTNPAPGCKFWMIGMIAFAAAVTSGTRRARRNRT